MEYEFESKEWVKWVVSFGAGIVVAALFLVGCFFVATAFAKLMGWL